MAARSIDLEYQLQGYNAVRFSEVSGAFAFRNKTPAHRFATVIAPSQSGRSCVVLHSRDYFDRQLASDVLSFALDRVPKSPHSASISILDGFSSKRRRFESVMLLPPKCAKEFEYENKTLSAVLFLAFPIYRCEFTGRETSVVIDQMRHNFVPTLDWRRKPHPRVSMAFRNTKTRSRSTRPGLVTLQSALDEVRTLRSAPASRVSLENFREEICVVESDHNRLRIQIAGQSIQCDLRTGLAKVTDFLMGGILE